MAQLKDLIVNGPTRLIGPAYGKISSADTVPVVNSNANLQFGQSTTIATIAGVAVKASLPAGGYQGPAGTNGTNGTNGAQGRQGPKGTDGTNGAQGRQGPKGSDGTNGTNGTNGAQGRQGPKGTDGTNGTNGTNGAQGRQGPKGTDGTNGTNGTNGAQGRQGPKGTDATGVQGPAGTNGTNGTNGAQGRQGPKGTDATGVQGPAGTNGTNGTNGAQGRQGPKGTDATGSQGPAGTNGTNGTNGAQGRQGPKGTDATGSQGRQGPKGQDAAAGNYLPITGGTLTGDLRIKDSSNYGRKINFGDGDYVYFHENSDDHLNIYAAKGISISVGDGYSVEIDGFSGGAQGRQGPKGSDGTGSQGRQGPKGTDATGSQGRQGPKGTDGTGSQGPKGDQGPAGSGGGGSAISVKASTGSTACYLLGINSTTATGTGVELTSSNVFRAGNGSSNGVWFASKNLYASSDERLKDFKGDIDIDFEKLSTIPKKYFTWKEDGSGGSVNIGTSAQKLKEVYPSLVMGDDNDYYGVAYDKLSIVALAAIDKLHEENLELKNEIAELKEEIKRLGLNNQIYG